MKRNKNGIIGKALAGIFAFGLSAGGAQAASVRLTGGGSSGQTVQIEIMEDIIISTNSGSTFGGYQMGFQMTGVLSSWDNYYRQNQPTTGIPPFEYVTSSGQSAVGLTNAAVSMSGGNLRVVFEKPSSPEMVIGEGGSITFKAGTITRASVGGGNNVLVNPGQIYDLPMSAFFAFSEEGQPSMSASNSSISSVPEASSALLLMLGVSGAVFGRRRTMAA